MPDYGSGVSGGWTQNTPKISPDSTLQIVHDRAGVLAIGDSILWDAATALGQMVNAHGLNFAVNAWPSRPTQPAVDWLEDLAARDLLPAKLVMATGANDVFSPLGFASQVGRVMNIMGSRPVFWTTAYVDRWAAGKRPDDMANSALINRALYLGVGQFPNLRLVDWNFFLRSVPGLCHPASFPNLTTVLRPCDRLRDGVHLTSSGSSSGIAGWVALIEQAMFPA